MNKKHLKTLRAIFEKPTASNIDWKNVESLLLALDAELSEGQGSRIRVKLNNVRAVFHRPHPEKEIDKGAVRSLRRFLENCRINYDKL